MSSPTDRAPSSKIARRMALSTLVVGSGLGAGVLLARSRFLRRPPKIVVMLEKKQNGQLIELPANPDDAPRRGPKRAPVSLVLFADLECALCRKHASTLDRLLGDYGDRLNLTYRHYAMGAAGRDVGQAAEAARRQGKFWEMYAQLCAGSGKWKREELLKIAAGLRLDLARFTRDLDGVETKRRVEGDSLDALSIGLPGAPATFVNGRMMLGAEPPEAFHKLIDEELRGRGRRA